VVVYSYSDAAWSCQSRISDLPAPGLAFVYHDGVCGEEVDDGVRVVCPGGLEVAVDDSASAGHGWLLRCVWLV
jgi:hypothetical protein